MKKILLYSALSLSLNSVALADTSANDLANQMALYENVKSSLVKQLKHNSYFLKSNSEKSLGSMVRDLENGANFSDLRNDLLVLAIQGSSEDLEENMVDFINYLVVNLNDISTKDDETILKWVNLLDFRMKTGELSDFELPVNEIINYFQQRVSFIEVSQSYEEGLFDRYSLLNRIVEQDAVFIKIMKPLFEREVLSVSSSVNSIEAYKRILNFKIQAKKHFSVTLNILNSLENINQKSLLTLKKGKKVNLDVVYENLDLYMTVFDRPENMLTKVSKESWIESIDARANVLYELWVALKSHGGKNIAKSFENQQFPKHPMSQIYFLRAYIESAEKLDVSELPGDFTIGNGINYYKKTIQEDFRGVVAGTGELRQYINEFNQVELLRFMLELESSKRKVHVSNRTDKEVGIYHQLVNHVIKANNIRYNKQLSLNSIQGLGESDFRSLENSRIETDIQNILSFCKVGGSCGEKLIPAGIYYSNVDLVLQGDIVRFHPLAMIYAPGKNITIKTSEMINPWLDTSGRLPNKTGFTPGRNGSKSSLVHSGGYHNITQGVSPGKQTNGDNGQRAGNILSRVNTPSFLPLYVAMGGVGASGHAGKESPQCSSGAFKVQTFSAGRVWTTQQAYQVHTGRRCSDWEWLDPPGHDRFKRKICVGYEKTYSTRHRTIGHDTRKNTQTFVSRGAGGNGGVAGHGGSITLNPSSMDQVKEYQVNFFVNPGVPGSGGKPSACGPSTDKLATLTGTSGKEGSAGSFHIQ
ncbi:hypothetical protein A9Q84_05540 [Halobacteriovorax marinus]|uniref:Uncharacterized protein n=1 Tax=Halobacteriovorax marinus TaxID=97084 RepID=A0A1Y5FB92_9BACT|nr:hypothetical protein A9Q84_05540 [Halobacteriovorax marinus]